VFGTAAPSLYVKPSRAARIQRCPNSRSLRPYPVASSRNSPPRRLWPKLAALRVTSPHVVKVLKSAGFPKRFASDRPAVIPI
jgi:hypothetical protein